jgi:BirA family biotin operon repressor/biotin-[acetyl-CoA-carboxylase] ligase
MKNNIKILYFDELVSTQDYAKNLVQNGKNVMVIAKKQTGGKGTKGRSFVSEIGGIYLSYPSCYMVCSNGGQYDSC